MNVVEGLAYLRKGMEQAGMTRQQLHVGMDLQSPANRDSTPSVSIYLVATRYRRSSRKAKVTTNSGQAVRRSLMDGFTWYQVTLKHKSMPEMQAVLNKFLAYLVETNLVDAAGNIYPVLTEGDGRELELIVTWNDHDEQGVVTATFQLPLPGITFKDHPLVQIEVLVEALIEGGNPDE